MYLLRTFDNTIHALSGQVFDKLLQVSASLLNLFVLVADIALFDGLVQSILSFMSVLLDDTDEGVDSLVVSLVLLGVENNLLESRDKLVLGLVGGGKLLIQVLQRNG